MFIKWTTAEIRVQHASSNYKNVVRSKERI